jgi:hypothetical protein
MGGFFQCILVLSTRIIFVYGSTLDPSSVTISPSILTRPERMSTSAALLEHTPAFRNHDFAKVDPYFFSFLIIHLVSYSGKVVESFLIRN